MKSLFLFLLGCLILASCNDSNRDDNIAGEQYSINIERDTTLKTKNGALLEIPKGSLKSETGNTVTLEIKEAYSLSEMVFNGLVTQSNSEPLSSGGMIYINPVQGQKVTIAKPIRVALPADYLQKEMQLYKGEVNKDGKVNWVSPRPLPENKQISSIDSGQILFQNNCASCHAIGMDMTGPNLAHILRRFPDMWFEGGPDPYDHQIIYPSPTVQYSYTSKFMEHRIEKRDSLRVDTIGWHTDLYACNLVKMYGGVVGPKFDFTYSKWKSIYDYIQNESDRRNLPFPAHDYLRTCADSCYQYKQRIKELEDQKQNVERKRNDLIVDDGDLTKESRNPSITPPPDTVPSQVQPPLVFDDIVSPDNNESVYYQFSIETFGWYNIDVLLKNVNGNEKSELKVRVIGDYHDKLDIFLIIPSSKTYTKAGRTDNGTDEYAFGYKNGEIYLPQNVKAYILGMTEVDSTIAFVLKEFTTTKNQELEISLKRSTPEEYRTAVNSLNSDNLHIKVDSSKNSQEIKQTDKNLKQIKEEVKEAEKLKPQGCDCDCGFSNATEIVQADTAKAIPKSPPVNVNVPIAIVGLSVKVFPNPSNSDFTINVGGYDPDDKINLRVMDIMGRLIEVKENLNLNQTIKIGANYKPGTYLIEVIQGSQQKTIKVIKQ